MGITIMAREGYIYTNGEIYGIEIRLAEGVNADSFYEIPFEEYEIILAGQIENENL